jgi:hypothetical protein
MLSAANQHDGGAFLELSAPLGNVDAGSVPAAAFAVFAARSIDLIWVGALIILLAWRLNWRNSAHWWLAPLITLAVEISLISSTIKPGFMSIAQASPGLVLAAVAIGCVIAGRPRGGT